MIDPGTFDADSNRSDDAQATSRSIVGIEPGINDWTYVPIELLKIYIETSVVAGTQWTIFEPNAEPLWEELRLNIGAFMQTLFTQAAFRGSRPEEAFFVKCDAEINTIANIDAGIVNIEVGFAPLKAAEFVVIQIELWAGAAPQNC